MRSPKGEGKEDRWGKNSERISIMLAQMLSLHKFFEEIFSLHCQPSVF